MQHIRVMYERVKYKEKNVKENVISIQNKERNKELELAGLFNARKADGKVKS